MGPGRLTGMNGPGVRTPAPGPGPGFNGARSIDRDERTSTSASAVRRLSRFNGARSIDRDERVLNAERRVDVKASMGPGRLTGMNAPCRWPVPRVPPSFNGARSIDRDERTIASPARAAMSGFNGARSIDRDERLPAWYPTRRSVPLQWGPVD